MWDHRYAGGSWAIVDTQPNEFVRAISVGPREIGKRVYLMWKKIIKPDTRQERVPNTDPVEWKVVDAMIPEECKPMLAQLRSDLKSGSKKIVYSHIVKA